ncbi:MAG: hypothetical protein KIT83_20980 [Bryobacterales bacterium]|nr:hypothetical protein [Bryobacterales bacterium]
MTGLLGWMEFYAMISIAVPARMLKTGCAVAEDGGVALPGRQCSMEAAPLFFLISDAYVH